MFHIHAIPTHLCLSVLSFIPTVKYKTNVSHKPALLNVTIAISCNTLTTAALLFQRFTNSSKLQIPNQNKFFSISDHNPLEWNDHCHKWFIPTVKYKTNVSHKPALLYVTIVLSCNTLTTALLFQRFTNSSKLQIPNQNKFFFYFWSHSFRMEWPHQWYSSVSCSVQGHWIYQQFQITHSICITLGNTTWWSMHSQLFNNYLLLWYISLFKGIPAAKSPTHPRP